MMDDGRKSVIPALKMRRAPSLSARLLCHQQPCSKTESIKGYPPASNAWGDQEIEVNILILNYLINHLSQGDGGIALLMHQNYRRVGIKTGFDQCSQTTPSPG